MGVGDRPARTQRDEEVMTVHRTQIFPLILIVLMMCAGLMYAADGNMRKMIYWMAAAILNLAITF